MGKYIIKQLIRLFSYIFYLFPVKNNKILFMSYNGKQYSCNPKYIYEYIKCTAGSKYHCVWCFLYKTLGNFETRVFYRKQNMILHIYHNLTSKIIIMNDYMSTYIPYRKKQIIINTWHGGLPSKKVGLDIECSLYEKINIKNMAENTSYVLSPSRRFSGVMFSAFGITNDKMLNFGFPRNDIFFRHDASIARKVKRFYNIPEETGVILYAPTFRGPVGNASTVYISNPEKIIIAAEGRFQRKYVLLVRLHHTIPLNKESEFVLNGNKYPDVQELLYASDIVISDYSSIVWDFFFTKRPFFLYTPDTEEYTSARGFYIPVGQWGFPLAKTVPELIDNIGRFNSDDHSDAINNYLAMTGSYEQGNATRQCVEFIDSLVNKYQEESQ